MSWKEHEELVYNKVKSSYLNDDVKFIHLGNSDSTEPDIKVYYKEKNIFNIEVKMPSAQSSQFVVLNNGNKFVFSQKNKVKPNIYSKAIIKKLNESYSIYKDVSTTGVEISIDNSLAKNWIISTNSNHHVKFIATTIENNEIELFKLEDLDAYFNIKTIYRRKKSGSSKLPLKYEADFKSLLDKQTKNYKCERKNNKLFVKIYGDYEKKSIYSATNDCSYYFSPKGNEKYEIRKLSKTNNPNIIFELSLKDKKYRPAPKGLSLLIAEIDKVIK